ncbi:helix-turn-helix domain-containing protein [Streptomyces lydicus]
MSDTTPDSTRKHHAVSAREPLTGLTGAHAAIYAELVGLTEPLTVAELALAAGVGHSTAGRVLNALEKRGVAVRTPGGHDEPRRVPDRRRRQRGRR